MIVHDELGTPVRLDRLPRRIVSLVPNLSELLWWAGAADRVVGVTVWCVRGRFPGARRVRGTKNPDVRAIVELAPDLVLANAEENRELDVRRLRDAGLTVYVTAPRDVRAAAATVARVCALVGRRRLGERLAARIHHALDWAQAHRPQDPVPVTCPIWRDPWQVVGTDTYAGELLRACGFRPLPPGRRYPRVELADIRGADPALVLLPDEPYPFGEDEVELLAPLPVRRVSGALLFWYGPRTPAAIHTLVRWAQLAAGR